MSESIEKGVGPDGGNPFVDGDVMWSFVEYFWEPGANRYTFDLSYIDEFSYPVTVKFSDVGGYNGAVEGHEYGPKKVSSLVAKMLSIARRELTRCFICVRCRAFEPR